MPIRGRTKSKKDMWIRASGKTGKWHRVDPTNGRMTACGCLIDAITWSMPTDKPPTLSDTETLCRLKECSGRITRGS